MHCKSCEILIEDNLKNISGVRNVSANYSKGSVEIHYGTHQPDADAIREAVKNAGYDVGFAEARPWFSHDADDYFYLITAAGILGILYVIAAQTGLIDPGTIPSGGKSLGFVLVVGLVAGFSTCMALIGGLVLGVAARHAERHPEATAAQKFRPHLFFNLGRILGYAVLGGLIGLIGSAFQLSSGAIGWLTILAAAVMVFLGLKLIDIFPALKNKTLALPKGLARKLGLGNEMKEYSHKHAMLAGALTFFLPCGFTQAMQLYAVSTGSPVQGAAIMAAFALGTAPGLLGIGGLSSVMKGRGARLFYVTAGLAVIIFGAFNFNNGWALLVPGGVSAAAPKAGAPVAAPSGEVQVVKAEYYLNPGLTPANFTVKAGQPVRMEIAVKDEDYGCMSTIMIPGLYNTVQFLEKDTTVVMEFTPKKPGSYRIVCAMGVPHGTLVVK